MLLEKLRHDLSASEDGEPVYFYLRRTIRRRRWYAPWIVDEIKVDEEIEYHGTGSSGGGRITLIWFNQRKKQ